MYTPNGGLKGGREASPLSRSQLKKEAKELKSRSIKYSRLLNSVTTIVTTSINRVRFLVSAHWNLDPFVHDCTDLCRINFALSPNQKRHLIPPWGSFLYGGVPQKYFSTFGEFL